MTSNEQPIHFPHDTRALPTYRIVVGKNRVVDLFIGFSLTIVLTLSLLIWQAVHRGEGLGVLGLLVIGITLLNLVLYRVRPQLAVYILFSLITIGISWSYVTGGVGLSGRFWLLIYPMLVFFLLGYNQGKILSFLMVFWILIVNAGSALGIITLPYDPDLNTSFLVLFLLFFLLAWIRALQVQHQLKTQAVEIQHERQLEAEYYKFKMATDAVSDQVVITDPEGHIIYANGALERITGWKPSEVLGQKAGSKQLWGGLMPEEYYLELWKRVKIEHKTFTGEITNRRRSGEQYVARVSISPILNEQQKLIFLVGVEEDITQEKAIDNAKTEFLSIASHQLQTPITTIGWLTEALTDDVAGKLTKRQKALVEKIGFSNQRMVELVNALLNTSRLDVGTVMITPEEIDVTSAVHDLVNEVMVHPLHKVTITEEYEPKLPRLSVDSMMFRTVIQNLLTNAIRYTSDGGRIWVRIKRDATNIVFEVTDTGIGIPVGSRDHIFTKFYRAPNAVRFTPEGIGLGMYITKSIIDVSGGSITFSSTEGKGTTFQVTYPLSGMKAKSGSRHLSLLSTSVQ